MAQRLTSTDLKEALSACGVPDGAPLAVAVSGGPDSLCLVLLASEIANVVCLTVDHGLRPESAAESATLEKLMADKGIPCHRLVWQGKKPEANIQAEARIARYHLMNDWCVANGVGYLLTAHHQDDQAETLLLRLARGSGVYGLAAMPPTSNMPGTDGRITLVRPLLGVPKKQLMATLEAMKVGWLEDPSNKAMQFDRVKVRSFLENPPLEGLRADRLAATAGRLRRTRDALEYYENRWLTENVEYRHDGTLMFDPAAFDSVPEEIMLRAIASMCRTVSGERYVPRMEKLERAADAMRAPGFSGLTLYGVQFIPVSGTQVLATRELRAAQGRVPVAEGGSWDNRFDISAKGDIAGLEIGPLGQEGWNRALKAWPDIRQTTLPLAARIVLPAVFDGEDPLAVPHLEVALGRGNAVSLSLKSHGWPKK
ncbi:MULTISPECIES: tRNA lysidine(34) synthetase TilS [Kordiimonas]|uniref:tRNA lysidine(34) synthetase TilS n=1 Tax=Kordiimonas TaxID=288021 RepID=UPI00257C523C|nr:tRNA lysidine(34) synthetase TilS [Kordiimonas sp. UBA4487]